MTPGENLGRAACAAAWACGGFGLGGILGIVLFAVADINLRLTPHEPPFRWVEPMMWTGFGSGVVAAFVCGLVAARRDFDSARARREEPRHRKRL